MIAPTSAESGIVYSCYASHQVAAEQCVATHCLVYLLAGSLQVTEAAENQGFGVGSLLFVRRNFLAKFTKLPPVQEPFQAITVTFDYPLLLEASRQHAGSSTEALPAPARQAAMLVPATPALSHFYGALAAGFDGPPLAPALTRGQQQEALRLLLQACPALWAVLFDFGPPGKIDLESFMRQHFRFNVGLRQLAYLTGRSLAAFKRDFRHLFHASPARWLRQQRLAEAYYLLQQAGKRPTEVYQEVGFESLAHFSTAFKQTFGCPPSRVGAAGCAAAPALGYR